MAYKQPRYRPIKYKEKMKCSGCGKVFPLNKLYSYVDGNNYAITRNSPDYCIDCYKKRYSHTFY